MTDTPTPVWLRSLQTHAGTLPCIVLHGETDDLRFNTRTGEYQRVPDLVADTLRQGCFRTVIQWDPVTGVHGKDTAQWPDLAKMLGPATGGGTSYSIAPRDQFDPEPPANVVSVDDFMAVMQAAMVQGTDRPTAFVVDLAHLVLAFGQHPSQSERSLLARLSRAITGRNPSESEGPANLVILISPNVNALPLSSLPGFGHLRDIAVPRPDRDERRMLLEDRLSHWKLKNHPIQGHMAFEDLIDSLDGMSFQDILNIEALSRIAAETDPMTAERLLALYRHGIQTSAWETLNREKLQGMRGALAERVKGQDQAIEKVVAVTIRAYTGLSGLQHSRKQRMPKGTLFFVGPTGVGKTELAKALAAFLFGDEEAFIRLDMSEFNHEHSDQRLVGAPPGYVGYEEGGQLTNAIRKRPFCVLLFDEIEKAHVRILDKFLQILEDGRLTDGRGQTVSFSEAIIIFTSNIGAAEIDPSSGVEAAQEGFRNRVRDHFVKEMRRPELLNRIGDNIVAFNFVRDKAFLAAIMGSKLEPLRAQLKDRYGIEGVRVADQSGFFARVAEDIDPAMGGRGAITALTKWVMDPVSAFLFNEVPDRSGSIGKTLVISLEGDATRVRLETE